MTRLNEDRCHDLAMAVVEMAVQDYYQALLKPDTTISQDMIRDCEFFFLDQKDPVRKSNFSLYCDLDGKDIMNRVRRAAAIARKSTIKKGTKKSWKQHMVLDP